MKHPSQDMGLGLRYIAVVGSRDARREHVLAVFHELKLTPKHHIIVSGGARGADRWALEVARDWGFHYVEVPAFWERGKSAGHARNAVIIDIADAVVAVWDGRSPGTQGSITLAEQYGKKCHIHHFQPDLDPDTQQVIRDD